MEKTNTLSDGKNTLKEMTHGNLKKTYKMQAKSCRSIFRVYQKQDNFLTELKPRGHKLHSAITPRILAPFPRSKMRLKALIKTFQTMPKMCQSDQYSLRYQLNSTGH